MFTAWQTARMSKYSGERLKPLASFLKELKRGQSSPRPPQSRDERIAALRAIMATMGTAPNRSAS